MDIFVDGYGNSLQSRKKKSYSLRTASDVMQALFDGADLFNVRTGEFYSTSVHQLFEDGITTVVGKVSQDTLSDMYNEVSSASRFAETDMAYALEHACTTYPRRQRDDGLPISWKEASRIAHAPGWGNCTPERVYSEPGLGLPEGEIGQLEALITRRRAEQKLWNDVPFAEKRTALADKLAALGYDPEDYGNPMTLKQTGYLMDIVSDYRLSAPDELVDVFMAGALSSKEARNAIGIGQHCREAGDKWIEPGQYREYLEGAIAKAHLDYAIRRGGFVPVNERKHDHDAQPRLTGSPRATSESAHLLEYGPDQTVVDWSEASIPAAEKRITEQETRTVGQAGLSRKFDDGGDSRQVPGDGDYPEIPF